MSDAVHIETMDLEPQAIEEGTMSGQILVPSLAEAGIPLAPARPGRKPRFGSAAPFRASALLYSEDETAQRQAELFYLQKQIQSQTPMVIVLEDGETVEGCLEWYDRNAVKLRGKSRMLIYKSAIKYMYKQGEIGS